MLSTHPIPKLILTLLLAIGVAACALIGAYPEDPTSSAPSERDTVDVRDDRGGQLNGTADSTAVEGSPSSTKVGLSR